MQAIFFGLGLLAVLGLAVPDNVEAAMMAPVKLVASPVEGNAAIQPVSFWARPFPSGYSGWHRCRKQRVLVETPYGPKWRRVCV